jgi:hypothetical protein
MTPDESDEDVLASGELLDTEDEEEMFELARQQKVLSKSEFKRQLYSGHTRMIKKMKTKLRKRFPDMSEDEMDSRIRYALLQSMKRASERVQSAPDEPLLKPKAPAAPVAPTSPAAGEAAPEEFKVSPEAQRKIPMMLRNLKVNAPAYLEIPGVPRTRFLATQQPGYSPAIRLQDRATGHEEIVGDPERVVPRAMEIVQMQNELDTVPMPINSRTKLPTIVHENYVIERHVNDLKKLLWYEFYPRGKPNERQVGPTTLEKTKEAVDELVMQELNRGVFVMPQ